MWGLMRRESVCPVLCRRRAAWRRIDSERVSLPDGIEPRWDGQCGRGNLRENENKGARMKAVTGKSRLQFRRFVAYHGVPDANLPAGARCAGLQERPELL